MYKIHNSYTLISWLIAIILWVISLRYNLCLRPFFHMWSILLSELYFKVLWNLTFWIVQFQWETLVWGICPLVCNCIKPPFHWGCLIYIMHFMYLQMWMNARPAQQICVSTTHSVQILLGDSHVPVLLDLFLKQMDILVNVRMIFNPFPNDKF